MPLRILDTEAQTRDPLTTCYTTNLTNTNNVLPFSSDGLTNGTINQSTDSYLELQHLRFSPAQNTAMTITRMLELSCFKDTFLGVDKNSIFGRDMYLRMNTLYGTRLGFNCTSTANPNSTATAFVAGTSMPPNYINVTLWLYCEENKVLTDSLMSALMSGSIKYNIPYTYTYRYSGSGSSSNMSITLTRQFGEIANKKICLFKF
jgi:hypothetical protein